MLIYFLSKIQPELLQIHDMVRPDKKIYIKVTRWTSNTI